MGNLASASNSIATLFSYDLYRRFKPATPEHRLVSIEDVGNLAAFLVGDSAAGLTGNVEYIDAGYHIVG